MRIDPKDIQTKSATIQSTETQLKTEFFGIDKVIDEVIYHLRPWYILPQIDQTPTIINLWGMTGVGKTSLVRRLADEINVPLLEVDMGGFKGFSRFGEYFYEHFSDFAKQRCIILLDEFQKCRTVDEGHNDQEDSSIREVWSLLSDGQVQTPEYYNSVEATILDLQRKLEHEKRTKNLPPPKTEADQEAAEEAAEALNDYDYREEIEFLPEDTWFYQYHAGQIDISPRMIKRIAFLTGRSQDEIASMFKSDVISACEFCINLLVNKKNQNTMLDFSQALVFVCGNLDDLYSSAYNTNPDIDADTLNKLSMEITIPDVKENLLSKFKLEQIARFGNNHLIYPSLCESDYYKIIRATVAHLVQRIKETFGITIKVDQNIIDLIYREGVYPTQGTRPVFSTIKSLLEANIPKFIYSFVEAGQTSIRSVHASHDPTAEEIVWKSSKHTCRLPMITNLEKLKQPKRDDFHAVCAVHEAGHAVALVKLMNIYPDKVTVFSPNSSAQSYNFLTMEDSDIVSKTKGFLKGQIVMGYSGYAAECAVFGAEFVTQGAKTDLNQAAEAATEYVLSYGFSKDPFTAFIDENSYPQRTPAQEETITKLLRDSHKKALDIARENEAAILALADRLLSSESLTASDVKEVLDQFDIKPDPDDGALSKFETKLQVSRKKDVEEISSLVGRNLEKISV